MKKYDKEIQKAFLEDEKKVLKELDKIYKQAQKDISNKLIELDNREDLKNLQSIIYQKEYLISIQKEISGYLDILNSGQFSTISDYLTNCYKNGFIGNLYSLQEQGIPLTIPIDPKEVINALQLKTQISDSLYAHLNENVEELKKNISKEIARGISTKSSYQIIAKKLSKTMIGDYNNPRGAYAYAIRIARTEGHRIQVQSALDSQRKAQKAGAKIVKQWDSTLDNRTRPNHALLDGQIRELDEDFEVAGLKATAPGMFGIPSEDCNCRCALLQRAEWALDETELQQLQERANFYGLDKSQNFEEFKAKYLKIEENLSN